MDTLALSLIILFKLLPKMERKLRSKRKTLTSENEINWNSIFSLQQKVSDAILTKFTGIVSSPPKNVKIYKIFSAFLY